MARVMWWLQEPQQLLSRHLTSFIPQTISPTLHAKTFSPAVKTMTMMSTHGSFCPPSQVQLALALAIVKSKPGNTTIKDHILELRRHIQTGQREQALATADKHLDSATFWRRSYEKSEATQSQLLDRIYELEQRNEALLLAKDHEAPGASQGRSSTKRKTTVNEGSKSHLASGPQKRTRAANGKETDTQKRKDTRSKVIASFEVSQDPIASLMRHFYTLRRLMQKKIDPSSLAAQCVELCKAAASSINAANDGSGQRLVPNLEDTLGGVEQCYPCLLQCLKKLSSHLQSATNDTGLVIYHIVQLLRTTLEQFHNFTLCKVQKARTSSKKASQRTKTKATKSPSQGENRLPPRDTQRVLSAFSHLIATMVLSLDLSKEEQKDLLEGFLYVLLEDVGQTLGLFIFKDLRSDPTLRVNNTNLSLPDPMAQNSTGSAEFPVRELAAEWESKYLIWIVDRVMAFVNRNNLATGADASKSDPASAAPFPQSPLLDLSKSRLQSTLLKGVFGADDPEFNGSLTAVDKVPDLEINAVSAAQDSDPGEWFAQELWRLLGWDMLLHGKAID